MILQHIHLFLRATVVDHQHCVFQMLRMEKVENSTFFSVVDEISCEYRPNGMEDQIPEYNAKKQILKALRDSIIGSYGRFTGPYGDRPIIYADWTASGKCVQKVEDYLAQHVLPLYGNTHTSTSITGHQTSSFRHEARKIVGEAVNAIVTGRAALDVVIFTGNGTTAAVNKLLLSLGFNTPLPVGYDNSYRPIVFTSSYEHHSNLLTW